MILFDIVDILTYFVSFCSAVVVGEPRLPGAWGDQQEHAGTHPAHFRRRPAADLHTNAKRLVSPLHELPGLQKFAQHAVRAVPWILETVVTCDPSTVFTFILSKLKSIYIYIYIFCPVSSA